jgi:hypothetical protein
MTKLVTALLILGVSFSAAHAGIPCSAWTATHRGDSDLDQMEANSQDYWLDGFLTARVPGWVSPVSYPASRMEEWLTGYCTKHPHADITTAATAFVRQHTPEQIADGD